MSLKNFFKLSEFKKRILFLLLEFIVACLLYYAFTHTNLAFAEGIHLPGSDTDINKLEAAGTLIRIADAAVFAIGARFLAGLAIGAAAWAIKEQRFGVAAMCCVSAIMIGTAPTWVKNIFSLGGGTLFGQ